MEQVAEQVSMVLVQVLEQVREQVAVSVRGCAASVAVVVVGAGLN